MNEVELGVKAFWLVLAAGALSGMASWWAFRRWSNTAKLRIAVNRIVAHLFELRLFADEPALLMRAQRDLLMANGELLREVIAPSLLLLLPFAILLAAMEAVFGIAPLQMGRPAIVTLQCSDSGGKNLPPVRLNPPPGIQVETPPVRVPMLSQISWRVRPIRATTGELQFASNGLTIRKSISSAQGLQWLSDSRVHSPVAFLLHPFELPYASSAVKWISVGYPPATVFHLNWLVWFSLASVLGAAVFGLAVRQR